MVQRRCLFGRFPLGGCCLPLGAVPSIYLEVLQMQKIVAYLLELDPRVKDTIVVWGVVLLIIIDWGSK